MNIATYTIIGNGFIGSILVEQLNNNVTVYNRNTLTQLVNKEHNTIIVAAPTGNRLYVSQNPDLDFEDCNNIFNTIEKCRYNHLIYLSTVDVYRSLTSNNSLPDVECPVSAYGKNRFYLENKLAQLPNSHIVRLPSLCGLSIRKNILHDLKNQQWLDKLNLNSTIQWYPINRLAADIGTIVTKDIKYLNLVSKPIQNRSIVSKYYPNLVSMLYTNTLNTVSYDVHTNKNEYIISENEIWQSFDDYFY